MTYRFYVLIALSIQALTFLCAQEALAQEFRSPEQTFSDSCAFCHGHFIAPGIEVAPELRGKALPALVLKTFIRNGVGSMPAFPATHIHDREIEELSKWLKTASPTRPPHHQMPKTDN